MLETTVVPDNEEVVSSDEEEEEEDFGSFVLKNQDKVEEARQKLIYERNIISAVRKYPAIWDKGEVQYKNISGRPLLWQKVAREVGRGTWLDAKNTWKILNNYYGRYRRTLKHPFGMETAEVNAVSWPHFQSMHEFMAKNLLYKMKKQRNLFTISNVDKKQKPRKSPLYWVGKAQDRKEARKDSATAHDEPGSATVIVGSGNRLDDGLIFSTNTEASPSVSFQPTYEESSVNSMSESSSSLPAIEAYNELEQDVSSNRNKVEICSAGASGASQKFVNTDKFLMANRTIKAEEDVPEASSQQPPIQADNKSAGKSFPSGHASQGCPACQVLGGKLGFAETRTRFLEMKLNQLESKVQWTESENKQFRDQCEEVQNRLLACQQKTINYLENCAGENSNEIREMLQEILQSTYV